MLQVRKIARYVYVGAAWFALVGVIIPFFVAGMALFVRNAYWASHRELGWASGWPLLILILAGLIGWIPRRLTGWLVGMILLHTFHTILPSFRSDLPLMAAVHPVTALLLAWVTYLHARRANQMLLVPLEESKPGEPVAQPEPSPQT